MAHLNKLVAVGLLAVIYMATTSHGFEIPKSCENEPICEEKPEIYKSLQHIIDMKMKRIQQKLNLTSVEPKNDGYNNSVYSSKGNCPSLTTVVQPFVHRTNNKTRLVIQSDFFQQKFRITKCLNENRMTEDNAVCLGDVEKDGVGRCKTRYTWLTTFVFDLDTRKILRVTDSYPICCSCSIVKN